MIVDTACPDSVISLELAEQISRLTNVDIEPRDNAFVGVGGGAVKFCGVIKLLPTFNTFTPTNDIEFLVTDQVKGHAFLGVSDQRKLGMVIDMAGEVIHCQGHPIPFKFSLSSLLAGWAAFQTTEQVSSDPIKIVLHESVNIPPGETMLATGKIQDPKRATILNGQQCYVDPVNLCQGYGMISL